MSTRCQILFCSGPVQRLVYRHWDGYPGAVFPDLEEFLAWSERGDAEYAAANFLFWSKRRLDARQEQLGFGVCDGQLHGDVEYLYVVEQRWVRAYEVVRGERVTLVSCGEIGARPDGGVRCLPRIGIAGRWYLIDDRLRELRPVRRPHEVVPFAA